MPDRGRSNSNPFDRKHIKRAQKRVIFVCCEGSSEDSYLNMKVLKENRTCSLKNFSRIHKGRTDPTQVLTRMKRNLKSSGSLHKNDEAWLVIDRDDWKCDQIAVALQWANKIISII